MEALPITGIIDTTSLATEVLGSSSSLNSLVNAFRIPLRPHLLHCAGNDAHCTLQALLALLQAQYGDKPGQLERLARPDTSLQPCSFRAKSKDDWAEHLELDTWFPSSQD